MWAQRSAARNDDDHDVEISELTEADSDGTADLDDVASPRGANGRRSP